VHREGNVSGLLARGNFEVSLSWKDGALEKTQIHSRSGGKCMVRYKGVTIELHTEKGKKYILNQNLEVI
jgi:alpha-L-fucosidase 2